MSKNAGEDWIEGSRMILKSVLPPIICSLLDDGALDTDRLSDREYVWAVLRKDLHSILEVMGEVGGQITHEIVRCARDLLDVNKREAAVILLATAIEHRLNIFYRLSLGLKGLSDEQITEIIRSTNLNAKTGWLLVLVAKYELKEGLRKQVSELIEIRNQLVHFKAVPSKNLDDQMSGSHNLVKERIGSLNAVELARIPDELEEALEEALTGSNQNLKLAKEIAALLTDSVKPERS
ncbi:MAG TPA: hypothetical protein VN687_14635 [Blastocatellia bacterium]|nr:hypothetical protein [Blastocatellia bacterium]